MTLCALYHIHNRSDLHTHYTLCFPFSQVLMYERSGSNKKRIPHKERFLPDSGISYLVAEWCSTPTADEKDSRVGRAGLLPH